MNANIDRAVPPPSSAPRLSLVVLPLANIGDDPQQEYFVDGVTESLTTDLSRINGAVVIARNTAFTLKGKAVDIKKLGRELNVRYVLEGSVQRGGNRFRVNVQLVDAETGNHLWAERFDKPVADLFDMQDEIVSRLANSLDAELVAAGARRAGRSSHPDAMDLVFQGMENRNYANHVFTYIAAAATIAMPNIATAQPDILVQRYDSFIQRDKLSFFQKTVKELNTAEGRAVITAVAASLGLDPHAINAGIAADFTIPNNQQEMRGIIRTPASLRATT